jgi:hypothetical protein
MRCPKCLVSAEYLDLKTGNRGSAAERLKV